MRCVIVAVALVGLLLPGCGPSAAEREAAQAAADAAAKVAAKEAAEWKMKEKPSGPPVKKEFADIDEAWTTLSKAGVEQNTDQIWAAIRWLVPQGEPALERMTSIMNDSSAAPADRLAACMVLGEMQPAARPTLITAALSCDMYEVRRRAVADLSKTKPPPKEVIDTLVTMLDEEENHQVKLHVIRSLADMGEAAKSAGNKMRSMLENPDDYDQRTLVEVSKALKKIDPRVDFTDLPINE